MGNADIESKEFMRDNAHFADAVNYYVFDGRQKDSMMKDIAVQKAVTFVLDNAVEVEAKAAADAE